MKTRLVITARPAWRDGFRGPGNRLSRFAAAIVLAVLPTAGFGQVDNLTTVLDARPMIGAKTFGSYGYDPASDRMFLIAYGGAGFMDRGAGWVCPGQPDSFRAVGNTYAFSVSLQPSNWTPNDRHVIPPSKIESPKTEQWVWDNFSLNPHLSGFRSSTTNGYVITEAKRVYPHAGVIRTRGYNRLFVDAHTEFFDIDAPAQ